MTINGVDALEWTPPPDPRAKGKRKKAPRVHYSREYEEIEAYTAMGLSHSEYQALPGTPYWAEGELCKTDVIMWYRYHIVIENLRTGLF